MRNNTKDDDFAQVGVRREGFRLNVNNNSGSDSDQFADSNRSGVDSGCILLGIIKAERD